MKTSTRSRFPPRISGAPLAENTTKVVEDRSVARSVGSRGGSGRQRKAALDLREALGSTLDMQLVLERAYPSLLRLVDADCAALGVSGSDHAEDFEWLVAGLPNSFFAAYADMAPHDFVRDAVMKRPNVVLRDQEMISRRRLETNFMYRRAREVGAPLEQVMAVMLHVGTAAASQSGGTWQSGLSVYRDRRRPFGARERALLQEVTPALVNAVSNCRLFGAAATWQSAMSAALEDRGAAAILASARGVEVARTPAAAALMERWFAPHERRPGRLPPPLAAPIEQARVRGEASPAPWTWSRRNADASVAVSAVAVPAASHGHARWLLLLQELPRELPVPAAWRQALTPAEVAVCAAVLRGWDNQLVAASLGRAEETIKKQLQSVYDKLGIASRAALIARAAELRPL
jgi:DNA-binding CsgD family transcriptional regulator